MHKIAPALDQEVDQQDALVEDLLRMMLSIMEHVHDKAPPRKKEEKPSQEATRKKFQGPKTGPHGDHNFIDNGAAGWTCTICNKSTTTHPGWKRLVRRPCQAKKKTCRRKWQRVYHRRKWMQRAATKVTKGDTSANHTPVGVLEDGVSKWICTTCGKLAKKPTDLGPACTGAPVF